MSSSPFSQDQPPSSPEIKVLIDEEARSLYCYVEQSFRSKGVQYYLLMPIDSPVSIIMWEEDEDAEQAILIEGEAEIDALFPKAEASLAEEGLTLKRTSFTLTVAGELPEPEDDDILTLEIETERAWEEEEFQLLAIFSHNNQEYGVYTPLVPLLFFAKAKPNGELELLSVDELETIKPILEEWMFN
ncbi:UNVERIFIED_CONTAM: hypothetical protein BEN50_16465 [Euhalothece sp. KZN 001]